jgi:hypothetical protein
MSQEGVPDAGGWCTEEVRYFLLAFIGIVLASLASSPS